MKVSNLKLARLKAGFSQLEVARLLDRSENLVSAFETGRAEPTTDIALALAGIYGVDPGELFPGRFAKTKRG